MGEAEGELLSGREGAQSKPIITWLSRGTFSPIRCPIVMDPKGEVGGPAPNRPTRGKPINCAEMIEELCNASVALRESRRIHLKAYGTLIPHVFMATVIARVGQCLVAGTAHALKTNGPELKGIFDALENCMESGDREARNVVAISFVRDAEVELFFDDLMPFLGRATRAQMRGR